MSTRGTLRYIDNRFIHLHIFHECLDETVRIDLKIFGVWILNDFKLKNYK